MKKLAIIIFSFSVAALSVSAQKKLSQRPKVVEWADKPVIHSVPMEYKDEPAFFVLNDVSLDYRYEGRSINQYYTLHWIVKVLDDKGIASFNKIGIPISSRTRVPSIKARTILPNGKVYDIDKDMIKVTKDEHGRNKIVFAMEGVEKDAEIEILVKEIKPGSFFGSTSFQYPIPVENSRFELSSPDDMVFEEKGYNGFPDAQDSLANNRRHMVVSVSGIPALHPELSGYYDLHSMRAEYRVVNFVNKNDNDKKKLYTWNDLGRELYNNHCKYSDKERAAVNRYLSDLGVVTNGDELENIKKIENGIKNSIVLASGMDEYSGEVLDSIIAKKESTTAGYIKLFNACFTQAGVKHELGITADRSEHTLDNNFENWDIMDNYVFYFPDLKNFLSPTGMYCRYPIVPAEWLTTKGVFCTLPPDGITIGAVSEIKTITPLPATESQSNTVASVSFTGNMDAQVDVTCSWSGYPATGLREEIALQPKDKMKELVKKMVPLCEKPGDIVKYSITNEAFDNFYTNKPLELTATLNAPQLTETAGADYLFRLGDVISTQPELYSKKERKLPVDISYPVSLNRTIIINIPRGCKILNPEAIRMNVEYVNRDLKPVIGFKSDYTFKPGRKNGDTLIVTIKEFYSQIHFPVSEYNTYRKVFNAAADFNKVTLLMSNVNRKGTLAVNKKK